MNRTKWVRVNLRLPVSLHTDIKVLCTRRGRTLQAGLVEILEETLRQERVAPWRPDHEVPNAPPRLAPEPREIYQSPFTLREGSVGPECVNREGWLKKMWDADGRETDPDMEWFDFERDGQVPPEVREALSKRLRRKLDDAGKVEADPTPGVADIENQE